MFFFYSTHATKLLLYSGKEILGNDINLTNPKKFFGRHHDLVDRNEISISQMIMDILFFSYILFFPLSLQILLPDLTVYMSNTSVTLSEAVSANSLRALAFPIGFLVGSVLLPFFHAVLLCVFTFEVPWYDVCYDFRIQTTFV
jgi:hypothetical protein